MAFAGWCRRVPILLSLGAVLLSIGMPACPQSVASAARPVPSRSQSKVDNTKYESAGFLPNNVPMAVGAGSDPGKVTDSTAAPAVSGDAGVAHGRDGERQKEIDSQGFRKVVLYSAVGVGWFLTMLVAKLLLQVMELERQSAVHHVASDSEFLKRCGSHLFQAGFSGLSSNLSSSNLLYAFLSAVCLILGFFMEMASDIGFMLARSGDAPSSVHLMIAFTVFSAIYFIVALGTAGVLSGLL